MKRISLVKGKKKNGEDISAWKTSHPFCNAKLFIIHRIERKQRGTPEAIVFEFLYF